MKTQRKPLTGRLLEIATGRADLPRDKVLRYRERFMEMGFDVPVLDDREESAGRKRSSQKTGARRSKGCGNSSNGRRIHPKRSMIPSCGFLGQVITSEPCSCGNRKRVDIHECRLLTGPRGAAKRCVPQEAMHRDLPGDVKGSVLSCESCEHRAPPRWVSTVQLTTDTHGMIEKLPGDIAAVAGHARGGMIPAGIIASTLHLQLFMIRTLPKWDDVIPAGSGWRLKEGSLKRGRLLVVDDNCLTGNSLKNIRKTLSKWSGISQFSGVLESVVYVNPLAQVVPELWADHVPWPSFYEWNFFNGLHSQSFALDMDGVICCNPPRDAHDDGERYLEFLRNAPPLHLPRKRPVELIVTARLEKYRAETLKWLERHGVRVKRLEMMGPSRTQNRESVIAHKSKHFEKFKKSPGIVTRAGDKIFVESDDGIARGISSRVGGIVICPITCSVYK